MRAKGTGGNRRDDECGTSQVRKMMNLIALSRRKVRDKAGARRGQLSENGDGPRELDEMRKGIKLC